MQFEVFVQIAEPGSPAVFAGRPGRVRRRETSGNANAGLIEDWSQCIKSMGVSSRESWAYRLTDGTGSYWQSCGTQGKLLWFAERNKICFFFCMQLILNSNMFTFRQALD